MFMFESEPINQFLRVVFMQFYAFVLILDFLKIQPHFGFPSPSSAAEEINIKLLQKMNS